MKKIIIEKTPNSHLIIDKTTKLIAQQLEKEYSFKELKKDREKAFKECNKLVPIFSEIISSYKRESADYAIKRDSYTVNNLCGKFDKEFHDLINNRLIDAAIKAMIILTWDHVLRKYLKEAIRLSDFLGSQIALILLNEVNTEIEKIGIK